jgi:hypothetical protein
MAATVWKGHLTFGLVSIPVRLVKAARRETVGFNQLYRAEPAHTPQAQPPRDYSRDDSDHRDNRIEADSGPAPITRIQQEPFVPEDPTQTPVPRTNIVKGYQYEKDRYVVIEKEDLEKITPKTATEMLLTTYCQKKLARSLMPCFSTRCANRDTSPWPSSPCAAGSTPWLSALAQGASSLTPCTMPMRSAK